MLSLNDVLILFHFILYSLRFLRFHCPCCIPFYSVFVSFVFYSSVLLVPCFLGNSGMKPSSKRVNLYVRKKACQYLVPTSSVSYYSSLNYICTYGFRISFSRRVAQIRRLYLFLFLRHLFLCTPNLEVEMPWTLAKIQNKYFSVFLSPERYQLQQYKTWFHLFVSLFCCNRRGVTVLYPNLLKFSNSRKTMIQGGPWATFSFVVCSGVSISLGGALWLFLTLKRRGYLVSFEQMENGINCK